MDNMFSTLPSTESSTEPTLESSETSSVVATVSESAQPNSEPVLSIVGDGMTKEPDATPEDPGWVQEPELPVVNEPDLSELNQMADGGMWDTAVLPVIQKVDQLMAERTTPQALYYFLILAGLFIALWALIAVAPMLFFILKLALFVAAVFLVLKFGGTAVEFVKGFAILAREAVTTVQPEQDLEQELGTES